MIALLGPSATYFFGVNGPTSVSNFGAAVRDIGDVNGDGATDALVVCANTSALAPPFAHVRSGADGSLIYALTQQFPDSYQGGAIARLGDVTGDGRPDFALRLQGVGIGVYSGASGALLFTGSSAFAVDGAGDVNGDSVPDVLVGYPGFGGTGVNFGRVSVLSAVTLGAATATNLGGGCGAFGAPLLTSTPPVIGAAITFNLSGGTPGAWGNLAIDVAPSSAATFGPCTFHLDLAHAATWSYVPIVADPSGAASVGLFIPGVPTLAGVQATLQVVLFGTAGPLGYDISNGIGLVAGF